LIDVYYLYYCVAIINTLLMIEEQKMLIRLLNVHNLLNLI